MGSCASYGFLKSPSLPGTILAPSSNLGEEGSPSVAPHCWKIVSLSVARCGWSFVALLIFLHLREKTVNRCCYLSPLITQLWTGVDVVILGTILKLHLTPGIGCKTWFPCSRLGRSRKWHASGRVPRQRVWSNLPWQREATREANTFFLHRFPRPYQVARRSIKRTSVLIAPRLLTCKRSECSFCVACGSRSSHEAHLSGVFSTASASTCTVCCSGSVVAEGLRWNLQPPRCVAMQGHVTENVLVWVAVVPRCSICDRQMSPLKRNGGGWCHNVGLPTPRATLTSRVGVWQGMVRGFGRGGGQTKASTNSARCCSSGCSGGGPCWPAVPFGSLCHCWRNAGGCAFFGSTKKSFGYKKTEVIILGHKMFFRDTKVFLTNCLIVFDIVESQKRQRGGVQQSATQKAGAKKAERQQEPHKQKQVAKTKSTHQTATTHEKKHQKDQQTTAKAAQTATKTAKAAEARGPRKRGQWSMCVLTVAFS